MLDFCKFALMTKNSTVECEHFNLGEKYMAGHYTVVEVQRELIRKESKV